MIFQDRYSSLSPRMTVDELLREPLEVHHFCHSEGEIRDRVAELIQPQGWTRRLSRAIQRSFPADSASASGSLADSPKFIVCNEPIAARPSGRRRVDSE